VESRAGEKRGVTPTVSVKKSVANLGGMVYDCPMIPIVSIVGKSNSGKTTLIEKLIAELTRRGWRVATIKHNLHGFEIDHEGKDSWRHRRAGAITTVLASPSQIAVIEDAQKDYELEEIAEIFIHQADVILAEGYKGNPHPKIEVFRTDLRRERLCGPDDNLIALAVDQPISVEVPCFDWNDATGIVDLIEERFLTRKGASGIEET
jgi:molybdopterin-guanine dinucleotide biosynthesis adapter protein